jgi:hypothetical protein
MKVQVLPVEQQMEGSVVFCPRGFRERPPHCAPMFTYEDGVGRTSRRVHVHHVIEDAMDDIIMCDFRLL